MGQGMAVLRYLNSEQEFSATLKKVFEVQLLATALITLSRMLAAAPASQTH